MELVLVLVMAALVLFAVYLVSQMSATPPQTIIVVPSTTQRESGLGCGPVVVAILLILVVVVILGGLPAIG